MPDLKITCSRCSCALTHTCDENTHEALVRLFQFRPTIGFPAELKEGNDYIAKVTEGPHKGEADVDQLDVPFFCETYLYPLLGKEDARTVMALINNLIRSVGIEPHETQLEAWKILGEEKKEREAREERNKEYLKRKKQKKETDQK